MESRMKSRSMRLSVILLASLLVVGVLLLAACGGGSTTTTTASGTPTSVTAGGGDGTGTTATLTPKSGGTLRIAAQIEGGNIGWPATMTGGAVYVSSYYETLLQGDNKGNLIPGLAESYEVADDLKSITFTIRKGVKFSDGSDLTAEVVKWNLEQYMGAAGGAPPAGAPAGAPPASAPAGAPPASAPAGAPPAGAPAGAPPAGAPAAGGAQPNWASIEVVDPNTVRINLKAWDSTIPASFGESDPALYMVSKEAYDKNGQEWLTTNPVGTGAFTVAGYVPDASMKLVKNPNYWGTDAQGNKLPYLDEIDFTFMADRTTTLMMAKTGEVDMVINVSPGQQMADYRDMGWQTNASYASNEVWVPDSVHEDSPWSKLEVREAAEYAIDRVTIAEKFGYGYLQAPNQIPPRDTTAYDANYALGRKYDPEKAKQLLTQAGYPDGFKTTLIVWPMGNHDIALAEQAYLAAVGIEAEIEFTDFGKWTSYVGPQGTYHNAILEAPNPAQGITGLGCVSFAVNQFGNNFQKPQEFTQAYAAATSGAKPDVSLIRATTDILAKNALIIPVWEIGFGRAEQSYVVADFGRSPVSRNSFETAWLNK